MKTAASAAVITRQVSKNYFLRLFTASLKALPAENFTVLDAAIMTAPSTKAEAL